MVLCKQCCSSNFVTSFMSSSWSGPRRAITRLMWQTGPAFFFYMLLIALQKSSALLLPSVRCAHIYCLESWLTLGFNLSRNENLSAKQVKSSLSLFQLQLSKFTNRIVVASVIADSTWQMRPREGRLLASSKQKASKSQRVTHGFPTQISVAQE